jgi:TrmH family RNA methyltransferase
MTAMPSPAPAVLTSTANPRIKAAAALRDRRERDRTGQTLVDGARELRRALESGATVDEAFVCESQLAGADAKAVLDVLLDRGIAVQPVSETVLAKLAFGSRAEGVVAVVRIPPMDLDSLRLRDEPLVVVLEALEKPGNLGAVLRSADGAGADAVILADVRTDPFNPNAIRSSAGTIFSVPLAAASGTAVRAWLDEHAVRTVATRVDAGALYTDVDLRGPLAIVFGAEAEGLTGAWAGPGVETVRLPMLGAADSLNVSVSAAVVLYEARRQRGLPTGTR